MDGEQIHQAAQRETARRMVTEAIAWGSSFWFRAASDAALDEAALTAIEFGWSPKATKPLYLEVYRPD